MQKEPSELEIRIAKLERVVIEQNDHIKNLAVIAGKIAAKNANRQSELFKNLCNGMACAISGLLMLWDKMDESTPDHAQNEDEKDMRDLLASMLQAWQKLKNSPDSTMHAVDQIEGWISEMKNNGFVQEGEEPPGMENEQRQVPPQ